MSRDKRMLTSELLRYQIQNGQIFVIYVNPDSEKYLKIAQDIGELTAALEEYESYDPEYRIKRGLAKILENKVGAVPLCLPELPHTITRKAAIESLSKKLGISFQQIIKGMYADLKENHVMTEFDPPSSEWLLNRYNVALAQAMLYRASERHSDGVVPASPVPLQSVVDGSRLTDEFGLKSHYKDPGELQRVGARFCTKIFKN
ncbi:TPA: DUF790 family protein [Candidatus Poribacteria bacterium]|nr:DUF790 family protein [Candidatus Poribacteria bacterium]